MFVAIDFLQKTLRLLHQWSYRRSSKRLLEIKSLEAMNPLSIPACFHQNTFPSLGSKTKYLAFSNHVTEKKKKWGFVQTCEFCASLRCSPHPDTQQQPIGLE